MPTSTKPYDWIKEIHPDLSQLDSNPLTGACPPFPWNELGNNLAQSFELDAFKIVPGEISWRTKDQLTEGLGQKPIALQIAIPSFTGTAYWLMPEQEIASLESLLLTKATDPISFNDTSLSEAFYRFLALEVLYNIGRVNFEKSLIPILTTQTSLPNEDSLTWDISITVKKQTLWGRLIISQELRRSWVEYFSKKAQSTELTKDLAQKIEVPIHFEIGKTSLSYQEWNSVKPGDWIALDRYSLTPDGLSGRLMLTINGKNAFVCKLENGNVNIIERPSYHEEETPMAKKKEENGSNNEHEEDEDFSDLDTDFTDDSENEKSESETEADSNFDLEDESFDLEDELDSLSTQDEEAVSEKPENTTEESAAVVEEKEEEISEKEQTPTPQEPEQPFSPLNIEIPLVIEAGRIKMSMEKLLTLEPGNILELNLHPEDGVDLVVQGKIIGKGELVRMGEAIGVRVINLG